MNIEIESKKFDLAPEIISTMLSLMEETNKDGKEHGFLMCRVDGGQVTAGKTCTGNQCSIALTDCGDKHEVGSFHTHPTVISFSLSDYISSAVKAKKNPKKDYLLCVSLLDKGLRCKALTKLPSDELLASIPPFDTDETREMIKPFFTKRVNISLTQMAALLAGVSWDKLPESEDIIAVDEGEDSCAPSGSKCLEPAGMFAQAPKGEGGIWWPTKPTGQYPWSQKQQFKSVKMPGGGVGLEPIPAAKVKSKETEFIDITTIEEPDPELIHQGEVMGYVNALTPVQLLDQKDANGKWKIHDGRHRVVAWKVAGYKQMPVVFVERPEEEKK